MIPLNEAFGVLRVKEHQQKESRARESTPGELVATKWLPVASCICKMAAAAAGGDALQRGCDPGNF